MSAMSSVDLHPVGELFFDGLIDRPSCNFCLYLDAAISPRVPFDKGHYHSSSPQIYFRGVSFKNESCCKKFYVQLLVLTPAGNFALCPYSINPCGKPMIQDIEFVYFGERIKFNNSDDLRLFLSRI